jgi:hypothetical protein
MVDQASSPSLSRQGTSLSLHSPPRAGNPPGILCFHSNYSKLSALANQMLAESLGLAISNTSCAFVNTPWPVPSRDQRALNTV